MERNNTERENIQSQLKSALRERYREERKFLQAPATWDHLLESEEIKKADVITSYFSFGDEPDTRALNKYLIDQGKTLLLPKTSEDKSLLWIQWNGDEQSLKKVGKLFEPNGASVAPSRIDVAIIPALHVDSHGNRLGKGGGYYDRALKEIHGWKVALLHHSEMTSEEIPVEDFDVRVDAVATPEILVRFKRS